MKRLVSLSISLGILAVIYWRMNVTRLVPLFRECDLCWMVVSLGMVVPITLATAWRLGRLMPCGARPGLAELIRLILVSSVLNLVLPSKMGDLSKAWFLKDRGHLAGGVAFALVVFEKACDMLSLLLWCAFGLLLYPEKNALFWTMTSFVIAGLAAGILLLASRPVAGLAFKIGGKILPGKFAAKIGKLEPAWDEMHSSFWHDGRAVALVAVTSVFIWFLHLLQIWMFTLAIRARMPFLPSLALTPLAILAGLLPLTFAGIGTRDAALIFFFRHYLDTPAAAAVGILCTLRYVMPAVGGLPFAPRYLTGFRKAEQKALGAGI